MDLLGNRQEAHVKAHHFVFGVVGNPNNLVWVQAWVEGVNHAATAAHPKIQLQMPVAIPRQGGHPCALAHLPLIQGIGHLTRAVRNGGPCTAVNIALNTARHNFHITMVLFCKINQR